MLGSVIGISLSMLGTSWVCESTFSTVIFMKSRCKLSMLKKKLTFKKKQRFIKKRTMVICINNSIGLAKNLFWFILRKT